MRTVVRMAILGGLVMMCGAVLGGVLLGTDLFGLFNVTRAVTGIWSYVLVFGYLLVVAQLAIVLMMALGWWRDGRRAVSTDTPSNQAANE